MKIKLLTGPGLEVGEHAHPGGHLRMLVAARVDDHMLKMPVPTVAAKVLTIEPDPTCRHCGKPL